MRRSTILWFDAFYVFQLLDDEIHNSSVSDFWISSKGIMRRIWMLIDLRQKVQELISLWEDLLHKLEHQHWTVVSRMYFHSMKKLRKFMWCGQSLICVSLCVWLKISGWLTLTVYGNKAIDEILIESCQDDPPTSLPISD